MYSPTKGRPLSGLQPVNAKKIEGWRYINSHFFKGFTACCPNGSRLAE